MVADVSSGVGDENRDGTGRLRPGERHNEDGGDYSPRIHERDVMGGV